MNFPYEGNFKNVNEREFYEALKNCDLSMKNL